MKRVIEKAEKSAHVAAAHMEADLRRSALEHGWHHEVANSLTVNYHEGQFKVHVPEQYADKAYVHEFGDQNTLPTGVIRKYNNRPDAGHHVFNMYVGHAEVN